VSYQEVKGDLIELAKEGSFDVIVHGCNCFCTMGAGIAPQMAQAFGADKFPLEKAEYKGAINKLGMIDSHLVGNVVVANAYTQYGFGANHEGGSKMPLDYQALILCLKKLNHTYEGKKIGLPQIGCGLAGGDWDIVKGLIQKHMKNVEVTVVIYQPF